MSPADGTVMEVSALDYDDFVKEPCHKIVIFISVFDVHAQGAIGQGCCGHQFFVFCRIFF